MPSSEQDVRILYGDGQQHLPGSSLPSGPAAKDPSGSGGSTAEPNSASGSSGIKAVAVAGKGMIDQDTEAEIQGDSGDELGLKQMCPPTRILTGLRDNY